MIKVDIDLQHFRRPLGFLAVFLTVGSLVGLIYGLSLLYIGMGG